LVGLPVFRGTWRRPVAVRFSGRPGVVSATCRVTGALFVVGLTARRLLPIRGAFAPIAVTLVCPALALAVGSRLAGFLLQAFRRLQHPVAAAILIFHLATRQTNRRSYRLPRSQHRLHRQLRPDNDSIRAGFGGEKWRAFHHLARGSRI
jgi:hypothetical protein